MITSRSDKLNTITMQEDTIMTNKEKALALINTFASGDTEKAKELLAPGYIQHNLAFGTGADAFVAAVAGLAQAPVKTTVNNIRAFEDGDKVFLQTVYNFAGAGEQVAFPDLELRLPLWQSRALQWSIIRLIWFLLMVIMVLPAAKERLAEYRQPTMIFSV